MIEYNYIVWKEDKYYVSQCINVNVSSFGSTSQEAIFNLREAVELYLENEDNLIPAIQQVTIGRDVIHA